MGIREVKNTSWTILFNKLGQSKVLVTGFSTIDTERGI